MRMKKMINRALFYVLWALFIFIAVSICRYLDEGDFLLSYALRKTIFGWLCVMALTIVAGDIGALSHRGSSVVRTLFGSFAFFLLALCCYSAFNGFGHFSIFVVLCGSVLLTGCTGLAMYLNKRNQ